MKKEEVIKILHKEVGLIYEFEDENEKGELYITDREFVKASKVIKELKKIREDNQKKEKQLIRMIKNNKGNYVDVSKDFFIIKDREIKVKGDLAFLQPRNLVISNCLFNTEKNIEF